MQQFSPSELSDWFWTLIARAEGSKKRLAEMLHALSPADLLRFEDEFSYASTQLQDEPFMTYLHEDASEDELQDVANFVVSQGRELFERVWNDPSSIPSHIEAGDPRILSGVADMVHYERFGKGIRLEPNHVFKPYQ